MTACDGIFRKISVKLVLLTMVGVLAACDGSGTSPPSAVIGAGSGGSGGGGGTGSGGNTGSSITVTAAPSALEGADQISTVTANLNDSSSGTQVTFTLSVSNIGTITPYADSVNGVATATFNSSGVTGTVRVTAVSGSLSGWTDIAISGSTAAATLALEVVPGSITALGTAGLTATVQDGSGTVVPDGTAVSWTINNTGLGAITPESSTTFGGKALASFTAFNDPGEVTVTASSGGASGTAVIEIEVSETGSIEFESADPSVIGIRGTGRVEHSVVRFLVLDLNGLAVIDGTGVDFCLTLGPAGGRLPDDGGEFLNERDDVEENYTDTDGNGCYDTNEAYTDDGNGNSEYAGNAVYDSPLHAATSTVDGVAEVKINSGLIAGNVRIRATVIGTNVSSLTPILSIGGGVPNMAHFTAGVDVGSDSGFNLPGLGYFGRTTDIAVLLADRFGNWNVLEGTTVSYYAESGAIDASTTINSEGATVVTFRTQRPYPEIVAVDTSASGANDVVGNWDEESWVNYISTKYGAEGFADLNLNGAYDASEPFTDVNSNGVYDSGEPFTDVLNGVYDPGEPFTDVNSNGAYDSGEPYTDLNLNGAYDASESFTDANSNSVYDTGEVFIDALNSVYDPGEVFIDENGNGAYDSDLGLTSTQHPRNGWGTVTVAVNGEEKFNDENGNGVYDDTGATESCDPIECFEDTSVEAFVDSNDNGTWDDGEGSDPWELYIDDNANGLYTQYPNDTPSNAVWDAEKTLFKHIKLLITGEPAYIEIVAVDNDTGLPTSTPNTFNVPDGGSQAFSLFVSDKYLNPLSTGSKITITHTEAEYGGGGALISDTKLGGVISYEFPDTFMYGTLEHTFTLVDKGMVSDQASVTITAEVEWEGAKFHNEITGMVSGSYEVGGVASGLTDTGLVLANNSADLLEVAASGEFAFSSRINDGGAYDVTIATQPSGQTCTVTSGTGTINGADVASVVVTCVRSSFSVSGVVSGLASTGETVVLQNNGSDNLPITADGYFTFNTLVANGGTYSVLVVTPPAGKTCVIANGTGTISGADVANVSVTCI